MGFGTVMLIAAIVLLIMLLNEKKKTKRIIQFMTQLLQQNRISRQEHDSVINGIGTPGVPPAPMQQPAQPMPTPSAPQQSFPWQSFGQTQPAPQPQMQPAPQVQPIPQMQTQPQYNMPTNFPPKPQRAPMQPKPVNPAAIMLFIGVAFVILSGVIFSTANWHSMSDMQRVGLVAAAAAFFFGVSAFARRKLKLISTGLAFYMLGGVFTGISFLSLGYFRLMGDWFSTSGDGSYALYSVFMLIITAFSAGTSILYKKTAFTHAALYGAVVSLSLVAFQIAGSADSWALMLNCVSAILLFLTYRGAKLMGEKNDPIFRSFSIIITGFYAFTAVPELLGNLAGEWTVPQMLTVLLWTAELIFYAVRLDNDIIRAIAPITLITLICECAATIDLSAMDNGRELKCVIAAIGMLVAFTVFRMIRKLASAVSDGVFTVGLFVTGVICMTYSGDIATVIFLLAFAATVALAHGLGDVPETEQKVFRALSVLPGLFTAGLAAELIWGFLAVHTNTAGFEDIDVHHHAYGDPLEPFVLAVMYILLAFCYRYSGRIGLKLRSAVSDIVLTAAVLTASAFTYPMVGYKGGISSYRAIATLFAVLLVTTYVFERKPMTRAVTYIMRRAYPLAIMFFAFTLSVVGEEILYRTAGSPEEQRLILRGSVFLVLGAAVMVCFINIRKIRTVFSDFAVPICIAIQCFELSDNVYSPELSIVAAAAWAALSVLLMYEGFDRDRSGHLVLPRAFSPIALMIATGHLSEIFRQEFKLDRSYGVEITAFFMIAAAAVFFIKTRGSADKPEDRHLFSQLQYMWAVAAGVQLFIGADSVTATKTVNAPAIIMVCLCVLLYLLTERFKNNLPAILPLIVIFPAAQEITGHPDDYSQRETQILVISGVLFAVFGVFSRLFHSKRFIENKPHELFKADLPALAMLGAALMTLFSEGGTLGIKTAAFIFLIELSLFSLDLIREATTETQNKLFVTFSSAFLCMLVWAQPFGEIENTYILWKLNILPIIAFGIIHRLIWKNETENLGYVNFGIFVTAFASLLIDALANQTLSNTITVLAVTLTIMLVSFGLKNGKWFVISAASFLGLTLYITRDFLAAVQWWVYLLAAGILLIAIASVNEYLKTRGENLKDKLSHAKDRWK